MADPLHENYIFLLFESFFVKAFCFKLSIPGRKDSYVFEDFVVLRLPQNWKHTEASFPLVVNDLLTHIVDKFGLSLQDVFFTIVTDNSDRFTSKIKFPAQICVHTVQDESIVPYFCASYFDTFNLLCTPVSYFALHMLDNQGNEKSVRKDNWRDMLAYVHNFVGNDQIDENILMNTLLHPIFKKEGFFLSILISALVRNLWENSPYLIQKETTMVATGETFSWLSREEDILLPYLASPQLLPPLTHIYHDTQNILTLGKYIKEMSLKLLEHAVGRFVHHVGDIVRINARKKMPLGTLVGKITLQDDHGIQTLYPVVGDVMCLRMHGVGNVTFELHYPFYVGGEITACAVRDMFVLDTRMYDVKRTDLLSLLYDSLKVL